MKLTTAERAVAALVARGFTNDEVARELHLSAKTVEWNLTKIYRKLGVRSRTELAATWTAGPAEGAERKSGETPGARRSSSHPSEAAARRWAGRTEGGEE